MVFGGLYNGRIVRFYASCILLPVAIEASDHESIMMLPITYMTYLLLTSSRRGYELHYCLLKVKQRSINHIYF